MSYPSTAREHLDWAVERALEYFDAGDKVSAITSFLSDCNKHRGTAWIVTHELGLPLLRVEVERGRDAFEKAMSGYGVADRPNADRRDPRV